jgi:hypothetical protein
MLSKLSISISRLHRDRSGGLASAELVMGLPIMLLLFLALQHAHSLSRARQDSHVATRTAAIGQARNGQCQAAVNLAPGTLRFATVTAPGCSRREEEALGRGGAFWSAREAAARWRHGTLTSAVRRAESPAWVEARTSILYAVTDLSPSFLRDVSPPWSALLEASFLAPEAHYWTYADRALAKGYRDPVRGAYGNAARLFPGLFGS